MRRSDRQVTDHNEILQIIQDCKVCRLGLTAPEGPYIVPMNFGYVFEEQLVLYFHCAGEGRKLDLIRENPRVGFEMDCGHSLIAAVSPCAYGYRFSSVIGIGMAEIVEEPAQKQEALTLLMKHQSDKDYTFTNLQADSVTVIRVTAEYFTCKRRSEF